MNGQITSFFKQSPSDIICSILAGIFGYGTLAVGLFFLLMYSYSIVQSNSGWLILFGIILIVAIIIGAFLMVTFFKDKDYKSFFITLVSIPLIPLTILVLIIGTVGLFKAIINSPIDPDTLFEASHKL